MLRIEIEEKNDVDANVLSEIKKIRQALTCPLTKTLLKSPRIGISCGHVYSELPTPPNDPLAFRKGLNAHSGFKRCPVENCSESDKSQPYYLLRDLLAELNFEEHFSESLDQTPNNLFKYCKTFTDDKFNKIIKMLECPVLKDVMINPVILTDCAHSLDINGMSDAYEGCPICRQTDKNIIHAPIILEILNWINQFRHVQLMLEYAEIYSPEMIATIFEEKDPRQISECEEILCRYPALLNDVRHTKFLRDENESDTPIYSLLMMFANNATGQTIISQSVKLRQAITANGLNTKIPRYSHYPNSSALYFFLGTHKGCEIFYRDANLRNKIYLHNFMNTVMPHVPDTVSPGLRAAFFQYGLLMLQADARLISNITPDFLNRWVSSIEILRSDKISFLALLTVDEVGLQILKNTNLYEKITAHGLEMIPDLSQISVAPKNYSVLMLLLNSLIGREIFEMNDKARSQITYGMLTHQTSDGISALFLYCYYNQSNANNIFLRDPKLHRLLSTVVLEQSYKDTHISVIFLLTYFMTAYNFVKDLPNLRSINLSVMKAPVKKCEELSALDVEGYSPILNILKNNPLSIIENPLWGEATFIDVINTIPTAQNPKLICALAKITALRIGRQLLCQSSALCNNINAEALNFYSEAENISPLQDLLWDPECCILLQNNLILCNLIDPNHLTAIVKRQVVSHHPLFLMQENLGITLLRHSFIFRSKVTVEILQCKVEAAKTIFEILFANHLPILALILSENPELIADMRENFCEDQIKQFNALGLYFPQRNSPRFNRDEEIFLSHFINAYLSEYKARVFTKRSLIVDRIKSNTSTLSYVTAIAATDPTGLTRKIYEKIKAQGADVKMLRFFNLSYTAVYQSQFFSNPFSDMKRHIESIASMDDVRNYAEQHPTSRTAEIYKGFSRK